MAHCVAAGALAVLACALTLVATGATDVVALPGTPVPSAEVTWLAPVLRLVADAAAGVAVGCLLGAVVRASVKRPWYPEGGEGCQTVDGRWAVFDSLPSTAGGHRPVDWDPPVDRGIAYPRGVGP